MAVGFKGRTKHALLPSLPSRVPPQLLVAPLDVLLGMIFLTVMMSGENSALLALTKWLES